MGHILVPEDLDLRPRQPRAVNNAGVVQLVGQNKVFLAQNRAHRPRVGREPALEDHARLHVLEARNLFLQLHVDAHGSGDRPHRARPHAEGPRRGQRRLNQLGMVRQAQVVVAGQVDHLAAVVVAHRRLLIVQNAQLEVGPLGAQIVENGGQMGKLGTRSGLESWQCASQRSITRRPDGIPADIASKGAVGVRTPRGWPHHPSAKYNRGLRRSEPAKRGRVIARYFLRVGAGARERHESPRSAA